MITLTIEDMLMYYISSAIPGDTGVAIRIKQANEMEKSDKKATDLHQFIQETSTHLEIAQYENKFSRESRALTVNEHKPTCQRCGRKGHKEDDCYAGRHADGTKLTSAKPARKKPAANQTVIGEDSRAH